MTHEQTIAAIKSRLQALQPTQLSISDQSHRHQGHVGARQGGGHFHLCICSEELRYLPRLAAHQKIYALLDDLMGGAIHALQIDIIVPADDTSP